MSGPSAATTPAKAGRDASKQVELGYVAGAHGLRGQLKVKLHDATTQALVPGVALSFRVRGGGEEARRAAVVAVEFDTSGKSGARLLVEGVSNRHEAEALKSHGVWVDRSDLPALDDDEYYLHDLIGLPARHALVDLHLGKVTGVTTNGAQDLLEIAWRNEKGRVKKWLCPAMPGVVIETHADHLLLDPVEGFMPDALETRFADLYHDEDSPLEG